MCLDPILPKSANEHTLVLPKAGNTGSILHFKDSC